MRQVFDWILVVVAAMLLCYGLWLFVLNGSALYSLIFDQKLPGDFALFGFVVPELWAGVEEFASGIVSLTIGFGLFALLKLRKDARKVDLANQTS